MIYVSNEVKNTLQLQIAASVLWHGFGFNNSFPLREPSCSSLNAWAAEHDKDVTKYHSKRT